MATQIEISDPSNKTPIGNPNPTDPWRPIVDALLSYWVSLGRCFSSGEVAAALREHAPQLRFSVLSVGDYLRGLFYGNTLPQYPDSANPGSFTQSFQVPRVTEGLYPDRTPAGVEVFVYCPSPTDGQVHQFEVFIPKPGGSETMADAPVPQPTQTSMAAADPTGKTPSAVAILGAKIAVADIRATVHNDKRLCIPRSAFESAVALSGNPMRGGDPVWVTQVGSIVTVSTSDPQDPSAKVYDVGRSEGRVLFPSLDPTIPFNVGDVFQVKVTSGQMTMDISKRANN